MPPIKIEDLPYRRCVGVMLRNAEGRIFVGQRRDRDTDAWQMPQGGIDKGEKPRAAAMRELWEETGVTSDLVEVVSKTKGWLKYDLPPELVPNIWKGRFRGQKQKWFLLQFTGADEQIDIATEHPEFSEWRWLAASELVDNIVPFKREVYAQVIAAFSKELS